MQIISKGRVPGSQVYQTTCRNCGTMFQFFRHEAREVTEFQVDTFLEIMCPLEGCLHMCSVNVKKPNFARD